MTREQAIAKVKGYLTDYLLVDDAGELDEITNALQQDSKWIPVSERLPKAKIGDSDDSDWVLITKHIMEDDDRVGRAHYNFSEEQWYSDVFEQGEITAWMPMPKAYKAESEDTKWK